VLLSLEANATNHVFDSAHPALQVNAANKCVREGIIGHLVLTPPPNRYIGGGVMGGGCASEELRFAQCPEFIASCLFTEVLAENECLIVSGARRYSQIEGYGHSAKFVGSYQEKCVSAGYSLMRC
jgi:hypothetical protein